MALSHKSDIGTTIVLTITDETGAVVDISSATTKTFYFIKPDGTTVTKTAVFTNSGTDGKLQYVIVANDLSAVGNWQVQAYIDMPSGKWYSDFFRFDVEKNAL